MNWENPFLLGAHICIPPLAYPVCLRKSMQKQMFLAKYLDITAKGDLLQLKVMLK